MFTLFQAEAKHCIYNGSNTKYENILCMTTSQDLKITMPFAWRWLHLWVMKVASSRWILPTLRKRFSWNCQLMTGQQDTDRFCAIWVISTRGNWNSFTKCFYENLSFEYSYFKEAKLQAEKICTCWMCPKTVKRGTKVFWVLVVV